VTIGVFQKRVEDRRFMRLTRGQMNVQRMPVAIAKKVDLRGKAATRAS
jgi:hypothetical protein